MTSYTSKIEDTVYCNDRTISKMGGWSPTGSMTNNLYFSGYTRTFSTHKPSLVCERANDRFTVSASLGNGKLTYPVGLLTTDEIVYAGGKGSANNKTYYLYTGQSYWAGSPYYFDYFSPRVIRLCPDGGVDQYTIYDTLGLRPVISLSKNTSVSSGNGTANNPYVIE